jgi:hypothetical protein
MGQAHCGAEGSLSKDVRARQALSHRFLKDACKEAVNYSETKLSEINEAFKSLFQKSVCSGTNKKIYCNNGAKRQRTERVPALKIHSTE